MPCTWSSASRRWHGPWAIFSRRIRFGLPIALFVVPLAVFFLARLVLGPLLYWRRVPCSAAGIAGAALAGMGLSHSVARGIIAGLIGRRAVFHVTRRVAPAAPAETPVSAGKRGWLADVREEAALLLGLLACIATLAVHREPGDTALGDVDAGARHAVPALRRRAGLRPAVPPRQPAGLSTRATAKSRRPRYGGYLAFDASLTVSPAIMNLPRPRWCRVRGSLQAVSIQACCTSSTKKL
jgi:hypothetical protein